MAIRGGRPSRAAVQTAFDEFRLYNTERQQQAALRATDRARLMGLRDLRAAMGGAGLAKLGQAMGSTSDLAEGRGVHRRGGAWSASGMVFVRSGSERSRGALWSYFYGADILPRRGRWLWIATDALPRVTGKFRMTPELYRANGWEQKLGPLIPLKSINGYPLLAVENVGVSETGARSRVRGLTKSGRPRRGDRPKQLAVLFIGIPRTSRVARLDPEVILGRARQLLPQFVLEEMRRG